MGKKRRQPSAEDQAKLAQAKRADQMGDVSGARATYESLAKKFPDQAELHFAAGHAAMCQGDQRAALSRFDRAAALDPRQIHYHTLRAVALGGLSRVSEGLEAADRAMAIRPGEPSVLGVKGELLRLDGRAEEACELLEGRIESLAGHVDVVDSYAQAAMAAGRHDGALAGVRLGLAASGLAQDGRSRLLFRLGAVLDRRGEYDEAFEAFEEANRLKGVAFDPDGTRLMCESRVEAWSAACLKGLPRARGDSELPVFVVGMPRSGTTLVEQIIASHPLAYGGGERDAVPQCGRELFREMAQGKPELACVEGLRQGPIDRVSRRELRVMEKEGKGAARFSDKMMTNFWHLGLVSLLFPGARVLYCRRDALDTCLSCFFHDFTGVNAQAYSYDFEHLAMYLRLSERLMSHWAEVLSIPILEVWYEEVVGDQEGQTRRILEFLGLEWDEACMAFHKTKRDVVTLSAEQVRRPMYGSSVRRHENYTAHLGPLREALGMA